ncbi:NADH-quinone oxidoreductase subunit J [Actinomadura madurae]|uniref:NADH-quinone oxidoreductase subunit J n=1 Tax=Actinomadura madurae TaxID=1993 RepID=UPI002025C32B|nr:NADH-quinone oxidoreductase subunit J [Actinomadura madurae]MCQ0018324.1 NADH-quinone oxidoreductase subunit J [Actinomadura madurae]URM98355.1 NADH-quinone oxidoreductase subunit J [Actinomadura madurae]URN09047.1 NADH-quinone oxidoreductase subunit J [Actinomadura madurae]
MTPSLAGAHALAADVADKQSGEPFFFWLLAVVSVLAALGMIFMRKAVHSALLLATVMLCLAALYAIQNAPFLAFVQVIVYTGAVLMLFLFVLMLVGVSSTDSLVETIRGQRFWAVIAAVGFIVLLTVGLGNAALGDSAGLNQANAEGNVVGLARLLFSKYVFAFEATSALLITAALGAMVLAHRERTEPKATQRDLSKARFLSGDHPGPLPGPGTYARHNAVDMPALLPDGTPSELSVNPVIAARTDTAERHADLFGGTEEEALERDVAAVKAATEEAEDADAESRSVKSGSPAAGGGASEGEAGQ